MGLLIMTKQLAYFLSDISDGEVYEDYSGRGMYGKTTYGVVVSSELKLLRNVLEYMAENGTEEGWFGEVFDSDFLNKDIRVDNMGLDIILY